MLVITYPDMPTTSHATKCLAIGKRRPIQNGKTTRKTIISEFLITPYLFLRYEELVSGTKKFDTEGLNSLKYDIRALERKRLYTWILTEIQHEPVN